MSLNVTSGNFRKFRKWLAPFNPYSIIFQAKDIYLKSFKTTKMTTILKFLIFLLKYDDLYDWKFWKILGNFENNDIIRSRVWPLIIRPSLTFTNDHERLRSLVISTLAIIVLASVPQNDLKIGYFQKLRMSYSF